MIELVNVKKTYKAKKTGDTTALDDISFKIPSKGLYFITGESGSGKSTLLNVLGTLDKIDSGSIKIGNINLENLSKKDLVSYRNTCVGFIFQDYNLFLEYNVYDNVKLALELSNQNNNTNIDEILKRVGLYDLRFRNINELSGGQRQRVAIARALVKNPKIILADEPTGNLDSATSRQIMELLKEISQDKCIIVVTHDKTLAAEFGDGLITMQDGKVINDTIVALKDDDKNITLRSSNFQNKYAFKFTLHNIKMRPGKFILTTILTAFTLTLVCLMFTFLFYNDSSFTTKILTKHNVNKVAIKKSNCIFQSGYVDCSDTFLKSDDAEVKLGSPSYRINELQFRFDPHDDNTSIGLDNIIEIKNDNILSLFKGRLPSTDTEIVIDKNLAYNILKYGIYNPNDELIKPTSFDEIINLTVKLGTYPVTIVGINEFNSDNDFKDIREGKNVTNALEKGFENFTEDNNIYVKGFIDNKELLYNALEMLDKYTLMLNDGPFINYVGHIENKTYYTEDIYYYDMNFNLVNKPLESNEIVVSASDILNTNSNLGNLSKLFNTYQQNNKDLDYNTALFNFLKETLTSKENTLNVILNNYNDLGSNNDYTKLKIAGISFDTNTYLSQNLYNNTNHDKKKIDKIYLGFNNKSELSTIVRKYKYPSNIYTPGTYTTLVSDLGSSIAAINTFYHYIRPYLNIISLVFVLFASLLIFNFISTTITYAKKNIGILKSLGAKDKDIYKIFSYEAIIIASLAFILSIPLWQTACNLSNKLFFSDEAYVGGLEINILSPLVTLTLSIILSWLLSILCCRKINKMQPIDAILNK